MENPKAANGNLVQPQGEVPSLLSELNRLLEANHLVMDDLGLKLSPALRQEPGQDKVADKQIANTDLGASIVLAIESARAMNTRLADVRNRLEL